MAGCSECNNPTTVLFDGICAACWATVEGRRLRAQVARLEAANAALAAALEGIVPHCSGVWMDVEGPAPECNEVGVWRWEDHDGREWKCDKHKDSHFYAEGPELDEDCVRVRAALSDGGEGWLEVREQAINALEWASAVFIEVLQKSEPAGEGWFKVPPGMLTTVGEVETANRAALDRLGGT